MVRGLEEHSRSLTALRIGWSALAFIASFAAAVALTVTENLACVAIPLSIGVGGVAQVWDFIAHVMYLQDLWRPWLRGLKLFLYVGILLLVASLGAMLCFVLLGSMDSPSQQATLDYCSWNTAVAVTVWPLLSSAQLILHTKLYRDEFRDLRTLLDY